jgi:hypothetical protein
VGSRAGIETAEKNFYSVPGIEASFFGFPASCPSHYTDDATSTSSAQLLFLCNCVNHLKPEIYLNVKIQFLPHRKHSVFITKSNLLMMVKGKAIPVTGRGGP